MKQEKINALRSIIREHILGFAAPDFVLTTTLDKMVESLRQEFLKYIQQYKSQNIQIRDNAEHVMDEVLNDFKLEVKEIFEQHLQQFLNNS